MHNIFVIADKPFKCPPPNLAQLQETQDQSLEWEDFPGEGMTTCSGILAWRIPWAEEPGWATVHEFAKSRKE